MKYVKIRLFHHMSTISFKTTFSQCSLQQSSKLTDNATQKGGDRSRAQTILG